MAMATSPTPHRRSRFIELCSRPYSPALDAPSTIADNDSTACALSTPSASTFDNSSTTNTLTTISTDIATPIRPLPTHRSSHPQFDVTLEQVLADHEAWERKRDKRASTASWGSFSGLFALENGGNIESRSESRSGRRMNMTKGLASQVSLANTGAPPVTERMVGTNAATTTTQPRRPPIYHSTSSFTSASGPKHAQSYQRASIRTVSTATNQSSQTTSSVASAMSAMSAMSAASSRTTASRSSAATSFSSSSQPSRRSSLSAAFGLGKGRGLGGSLRRKGTGVWRAKSRGEDKEGDVVVLEIEEAAGEKEEMGKMLPMMVTGRVRPKSEMGMLSTPALAGRGEERQASTAALTSPSLASAKDDTVPAADEQQTTTTTEANVALALAQLTQTSPSPSKSHSQSYPTQTEIQEKDKKSQLSQPLPTAQALALRAAPTAKVTPHADASQASLQAKAKTKGTKRWSRILPWK